MEIEDQHSFAAPTLSNLPIQEDVFWTSSLICSTLLKKGFPRTKLWQYFRLHFAFCKDAETKVSMIHTAIETFFRAVPILLSFVENISSSSVQDLLRVLTRKIHKCPFLMQHLDDKWKTMKLCQAAVYTNPLVIRYVPHAYKCLYKKAALLNGFATQYINPHDMHFCLFQNIIRRHPRAIRYLYRFPNLRKYTVSLCVEAVDLSAECIKFVPLSVRRVYPNLCRSAIQRNPTLLKYVPRQLKKRNNYLSC